MDFFFHFDIFGFSYPDENNIAQKLGFPQDDVSILTEQGLYAAYIVIFLYLAAYASFELYAVFVQAAVGLLSRVCQKLCAGWVRGIENRDHNSPGLFQYKDRLFRYRDNIMGEKGQYVGYWCPDICFY